MSTKLPVGAINNEAIALIAHYLHFSYNEIMNLNIKDYLEFLDISLKIAKSS
ncbi:hypothetical protein KA665_001014 [Campylobacter lari]|nr:hypothetical protein [Campylobacter lari]EKE4109889.1 hypothetical protein [Campylobacter lari]ELJ3984240.1 hypothetical protein [Campylobacter lari]MBT0828860.1 hypothetical protein [Campylobacter lari]HEF9608055.1 hypothetical protein [Campylobacter coli]